MALGREFEFRLCSPVSDHRIVFRRRAFGTAIVRKIGQIEQQRPLSRLKLAGFILELSDFVPHRPNLGLDLRGVFALGPADADLL